MKITVSGEPTTVKDDISVAELIKEKDVENPQYVTVTVNDDFIESGSFEDTTLSEGDQVEFLYFMGGGC
jgi:sulfur carrier protein